MKGDFSRDTFDPKRHYRRVLMQQGRVDVDADGNEQIAIDAHLEEATTYDVVGPSGVPLALLPDGSPAGGFAIAIAAGGTDLTVSRGRMYVEGVLCENDDPGVTLKNQPDLPPSEIEKLTKVMTKGTYAIYLDVWERHLTALDDPLMREKALGGPDTASRTKTVWQVKTARVDDAATCATAATDYRRDPSRAGKMAARTGAPTVDPLPCILPPQSGYRSLENQLYRVEIHRRGRFGNARFKWSRENGSVVAAVVAPPNSNATTVAGPTFNVSSLGRDAETGFTGALDWIEALDDRDELGDGAGTLLQVESVHTDVLTITTKPSPNLTRPLDLTLHPKLRRWEQKGSGLGDGIPIADGKPIALEQGIEVVFSDGDFEVGDYWLIPARTATDQQFGIIEWPLDASQNPLPLPPRGIVHHYAPLAIVSYSGSKFTKVVEDCRPPFEDLVELTKRKYTGCCSVSISPDDLSKTTLQAIIDPFKSRSAVSICLTPGDYQLTQPLDLGSEHSNFTIEACPGGATLRVKPGSESAFQQGLVTIGGASNVTLRGLTIELPRPSTRMLPGQSYLSVGMRPAGCSQLTVEGCTFKFPAPPNADINAIGIFAGADCVGLRLIDNRFEGTTNAQNAAGAFQVGFDLFPFTSPAASGSSAQFVGAWLHDALLRDNFFDSLTFAVFVYADCGLVELASNTMQNCTNGLWFVSFPMLASAYDMAKAKVDEPSVGTAIAFHNVVFYALADPRVQIASSELRAFPLPPKFDPSNAVTVKPTKKTADDVSAVQDLFDGILPASSGTAPAAAAAAAAPPGRVTLTDRPEALTAHPLEAVQPVPPSVRSRNESFNLFEKQASIGSPVRTTPLALHFRDNDVNSQVAGGVPGLGLLVLRNTKDDRDTASLAGNTFIGANSNIPIGAIASTSRCTVTGNIVLNEAKSTVASLMLFPRFVAKSTGPAKILATAVTGNVFRGAPTLPRDPAAQPPLNTWDTFNSIS